MKIQDRAVLVKLIIESWGTTRQDEEANRAVSEAKNSSVKATRVSKRLAPEDTLKAVKAKSEEARVYLRNLTSPWTDDGARLLDAAELFPAQDELRRKYRPAWEQEVDAVISKLAYFRDVWGPANLGDLYAADLYPEPAQMRKQFRWKLDVLPLNPDSRELRTILGSEYVDDLQRQAEAALTENLVTRILEPIQNMVRRLTEKDGRFKDSLVDNVRDIARLIPALNLAHDARLDRLQQQIETDLTKYTADTLRRSSSARTETAQKAQALLAKVSTYLGQPAPVAAPAPGAPPPPELVAALPAQKLSSLQQLQSLQLQPLGLPILSTSTPPPAQRPALVVASAPTFGSLGL